jgi:hypothetical protein
VRNRLAQIICNWTLRWVSKKDYREKIALLIDQGLYHADTGAGPFLVRRKEEER